MLLFSSPGPTLFSECTAHRCFVWCLGEEALSPGHRLLYLLPNSTDEDQPLVSDLAFHHHDCFGSHMNNTSARALLNQFKAVAYVFSYDLFGNTKSQFWQLPCCQCYKWGNEEITELNLKRRNRNKSCNCHEMSYSMESQEGAEDLCT